VPLWYPAWWPSRMSPNWNWATGDEVLGNFFVLAFRWFVQSHDEARTYLPTLYLVFLNALPTKRRNSQKYHTRTRLRR
jgi:hypothetical protein